jgi:hypothetical protein
MHTKYYVRDTKGRIAGPFSVEAIKKAADEGRILPTWHLSSTQEKWTLAAKVPDLFPASEIAPPVEPRADPRPGSVHEGPLAMFLDTFEGGRERFKEAWPWIQKTRLWWVKLTRPSKGFIITEVGPKGVARLRYDFGRGVREGTQSGHRPTRLVRRIRASSGCGGRHLDVVGLRGVAKPDTGRCEAGGDPGPPGSWLRLQGKTIQDFHRVRPRPGN